MPELAPVIGEPHVGAAGAAVFGAGLDDGNPAGLERDPGDRGEGGEVACDGEDRVAHGAPQTGTSPITVTRWSVRGASP